MLPSPSTTSSTIRNTPKAPAHPAPSSCSAVALSRVFVLEPFPRLSGLFGPSTPQAEDRTRNVLTWEGLRAFARVFLPTRDDGQNLDAQCPALGESRLSERVNGPDFAQRPGSGENPVHKIPPLENSRERQRDYLRLCLCPCRPKRAHLSQAETMCAIPPNFMLERLRFSQAGKMLNVSGTTSFLWRSCACSHACFSQAGTMFSFSPRNISPWERSDAPQAAALPARDDVPAHRKANLQSVVVGTRSYPSNSGRRWARRSLTSCSRVR